MGISSVTKAEKNEKESTTYTRPGHEEMCSVILSTVIQRKGKPFNISILDVAASTAQNTEEEIENFYCTRVKITTQCKTHKIAIVMEDLNEKVSKERDDETIGNSGRGTRNELVQ